MRFCDVGFTSRIPRVLVLSFALTFPDWSTRQREWVELPESSAGKGVQASSPVAGLAPAQHPRGAPVRHQRVPGPMSGTPWSCAQSICPG